MWGSAPMQLHVEVPIKMPGAAQPHLAVGRHTCEQQLYGQDNQERPFSNRTLACYSLHHAVVSSWSVE